MKTYRVIVNGENLILGKHCLQPHGFYATRTVAAATAAEAEEKALAQVRDDPRLREARQNAPDDPPRFFIFGTREVHPEEEPPPPDREYFIYPEGGKTKPCCPRSARR